MKPSEAVKDFINSGSDRRIYEIDKQYRRPATNVVSALNKRGYFSDKIRVANVPGSNHVVISRVRK